MYSTDRGRSKKPLAEAVEHEAQADRDTGLALARTMLAVGFLDFAD